MALPALKRDPAPTRPILENLKHDDCEIVRRSVANNLNDISKDNPAVTLELAQNWLGANAATDALIKHGCRTLLKQGNPAALALFGFDAASFEVVDFALHTPRVAMGQTLDFSFRIANRANQPKILRLEYALFFLRKNGQQSKKVFKISEREINAGKTLSLEKKHRFKPITTRRYYAGAHAVALIVNGAEQQRFEFELSL